MKYIEYREHRQHGTFRFPIALYSENPHTPRYIMTFHWHTQYELVHILSGSFSISLNGEKHLFKAGDVVFIPDGVIHGGVPENCVYDCVVFDPHMLLSDNKSCSQQISDFIEHRYTAMTLLTQKDPEAADILSALTKAMAGRETGYEFETQAQLYRLFSLIIRKKLYTENHVNQPTDDRLVMLKQVLSYISKEYTKDVTLAELAGVAQMNPNYFCRLFRTMTGRTPIDYLNYFRVESACEMLVTKDSTITEVAFSCGFNDLSYFTRCFKKYKGITPGQYAKRTF